MDNLNRSLANFFSLGPTQRLADNRRESSWLRTKLADPGTRFVPMCRQRNFLQVTQGVMRGYRVPVEGLPGPIDLERDAVLLGEFEGVACFAVDLDIDEAGLQAWQPEGVEIQDLRQISAMLDEREGALLAYARAMLYWHQRHRFCGECGSATRCEEAGHLRVCTNSACAAKHFPRTDPAIIVMLADEEDQHCLLGRQAAWVTGMYSCLAGFVEPGETLEHAVIREVQEESGIVVSQVHYRSSQPWPFPCSIMLGFNAVAKRSPVILHDQELEDARWFSREAMVSAIHEGSLTVARPVSISYKLIEEWFDAGSDTPLAEVVRAAKQPVLRST